MTDPDVARQPDATTTAAFLRAACLDWRVGGPQRAMQTQAAGRMLRRHPELAAADLFTAVACGAYARVAQLLAERPQAAVERGGPRDWPPLLYLCSARLPAPDDGAHTVDVARLLLDHGADANAYHEGGNASIHYTALACVLGRGEERATTHPHAPALARLLMERGAEPYDPQLLYNVFADHDGRRLLGDDDVWVLALMHERALALGRAADWDDPDWHMLDMGGYRPGARYLLDAAVAGDHRALAEWMLTHGASANAPPPAHRPGAARSLYEDARRRGHHAMTDLLRRHGATVASTPPADDEDAFVDACLAMDRAAIVTLLARRPELGGSPVAIHRAAALDRDDAIALLLDLGVSPDVEDPAAGNARPLHVAAYHGAARAAALLVARGAAIDPSETRWGATPLWMAVWADRAATIAQLAPHSRDVWSLTLIGDVARLQAVLAADPARACVVAPDGDTPLMWLPDDEARAHAIVTLFLAHGADPTRTNARGATAADLACERGLDDAARALQPRLPAEPG